MEQDIMVAERRTRWGTYLVAFLITALMFATAIYASNYFNSLRISDIRSTQDDISTDILSLETQFDLLGENSCQELSANTVLPSEIQTLASQLSYMEAQGASTNQVEVTRLKRLYSLMEIKDYLLMKQIAVKCNLKPTFILYFYSNKGDCSTDCANQGDVLTSLGQQYPQLRIYSFDYNLDVSALQTLIGIHHITNNPPMLVINGKVYYGLQTVDDIKKALPALDSMQKNSASTTVSKK
jgi:hypothetical protein